MDLPYRAEYAKSGRASCKTCRTPIEKGVLRLAVMVQSTMFDGKVPHWYHERCFFIKQKVKDVSDISHFESLRWEDQEKIKKQITGGSSKSVGSSAADSPSEPKKASKRKSKKNDLNDFTVEYSKSSRATCRGCDQIIVKGEVRASKKDFESDEGRRFGGLDLWHHLECFSQLRHELGFWHCGDQLPGFKVLKKEDQASVKTALPQMKPVKKEEDAVDGKEPKKKPKLDEDIIRSQSQEIYKYRDAIQKLSKKELAALLEYNDQEVPAGIESILDRLADAMAFGTLKPCKECKHGQLVFRSGVGYFCLGNKTEWVKCESVIDNPKRKPFKVPEKFKEAYPFFNAFVFETKKRLFEKNTFTDAPDSSTNSLLALKSVKSEPVASGPKIVRYAPLQNMEFFIVGKLTKSRDTLKLEIMKLGGKLSTKFHKNITAVISKADTVKNNSAQIQEAKEFDIQVVPEEFVEKCKAPGTNAVLLINELNLADWGSDPTKRMSAETSTSKSKSFSSRFKSNAPAKVKLKVVNGVAVDPDSGLEDQAHVYQFQDDIYNVALSLTDLQTGKNSYYKLQVLESNNKKTYWVFRSWGRIGTTIGGNKLEAKTSREEALDEFKFLFEEKTANVWSNRKNFVKVPGKMIIMDISYEDDRVKRNVSVPSKLNQAVQNLVSLIFNVDAMNDVLLEFELDRQKMPLGKISKKQIKDAYVILNNLQSSIKNSEDKSYLQTILGYTNQFYSLIPHDFGMDNPPLLGDLDMIKKKAEMLEALMELEVAYSIVQNTFSDDEEHYIDSYYKKLNTRIEVLDKESDEFKMLQLYVTNSHAETHRTYDLEIIQIYKVNREGEKKRYKPFKKLHNRKLLWHGSRVTNYAGIMSQGLRIAPPEAPVTGYMFGKGVYFADRVSKSANYCMTNKTHNTGLVLLCEVALGNMHELKAAEFIEKLPKGKNSVLGVGKTQPDTKQSVVREDGVEIPLGPGIRDDSLETQLLYNEYIVYDTAQINLQYLVEMKFDYKY